jgi:hypothetical protein
MDRLTRTGQDFENEFCSGCDCVYYGEPNGCNHPDGNCGSYTYFTLVADRLAEYEDTGLSPAEVAELAQAKADGRVVVLPVSVGDIVYADCCGDIIGWEVYQIKMRSDAPDEYYAFGDDEGYAADEMYFEKSDIGKTVFLARKDAEKALRECEK